MHARLFGAAERAVEHGRRDAHLGELRSLVVHQRDEGRNHYRSAPAENGGQLVAQRFAAAGRHHDGDVAPGENTANDTLLLGTKGIVAPVLS